MRTAGSLASTKHMRTVGRRQSLEDLRRQAVAAHEDLMDHEQKMEIAARIRDLRERSPYTQGALADMLGISLRGYQKAEQTGGMGYPNVQKLAKIHGVTPDWIYRGDTPDPLGDATSERLERIERKLDTVIATLVAAAVRESERPAAASSLDPGDVVAPPREDDAPSPESGPRTSQPPDQPAADGG